MFDFKNVKRKVKNKFKRDIELLKKLLLCSLIKIITHLNLLSKISKDLLSWSIRASSIQKRLLIYQKYAPNWKEICSFSVSLCIKHLNLTKNYSNVNLKKMMKNRKENLNNLSNLSYSITKNLINVFTRWYFTQLDFFFKIKPIRKFQILVYHKTLLCQNSLKSKAHISEQ